MMHNLIRNIVKIKYIIFLSFFFSILRINYFVRSIDFNNQKKYTIKLLSEAQQGYCVLCLIQNNKRN